MTARSGKSTKFYLSARSQVQGTSLFIRLTSRSPAFGKQKSTLGENTPFSGELMLSPVLTMDER